MSNPVTRSDFFSTGLKWANAMGTACRLKTPAGLELAAAAGARAHFWFTEAKREEVDPLGALSRFNEQFGAGDQIMFDVREHALQDGVKL